LHPFKLTESAPEGEWLLFEFLATIALFGRRNGGFPPSEKHAALGGALPLIRTTG
jgi:hypothetical protein